MLSLSFLQCDALGGIQWGGSRLLLHSKMGEKAINSIYTICMLYIYIYIIFLSWVYINIRECTRALGASATFSQFSYLDFYESVLSI